LETVQTNIVNVDVAGLDIDAATFASNLDQRGVRGLPGLGSVIRFVTYRGIMQSAIEAAMDTIRRLVAEAPWAATHPATQG
jgi:threonine aldolase